jgi:hypothetical protein
VIPTTPLPLRPNEKNVQDAGGKFTIQQMEIVTKNAVSMKATMAKAVKLKIFSDMGSTCTGSDGVI